MDCQLQLVDYKSTGYFSSLVTAFLQDDEKLRPFYQYSSLRPDFKAIIDNRKKFPVDRQLLVNELKDQYAGVSMTPKVADNIDLLLQENTFTVCTAHQPNLFTGYLYFVYKILQAIKLADELKSKYSQFNFVPVYYMGSEDNDLHELGIIHLDGQPVRWHTSQSGAVGRMKPDGIEELITEVHHHLGTDKHAEEITALLKDAYLQHEDIQTAMLYLVNALFGKYGLVVLVPDRAGFKRAILPLIKEELLEQTSYSIVNQTIQQLSEYYHAQATPREINIFYLEHNLRERIIKEKDHWKVVNTSIVFDKQQLLQELEQHPERFSPNVILRGLMQEALLPDVAFIGGGGEIAYWMELKALFEHYQLPYPLLLLRNSVLWIDGKTNQKIQHLGVNPGDLFRGKDALIRQYILQHSNDILGLEKEKELIQSLFIQLEERAGNIDVTLIPSVKAEHVKVQKSMDKIALKFLRGEKKKFKIQARQLEDICSKLFPQNSLQERVENILPYYAAHGIDFIDTIFRQLDPLNNSFTILSPQ
jgi:bacillithiol synthase